MGNTIRRNAEMSAAQERRAAIIAGRRNRAAERSQLRALDDIAMSAHFRPARGR